MPRYTLNPDSTIPVYRQLADQMHAEIRSGALRAGQKLPTVREMADALDLSCGTVKRVYDHLRERGDVEMTRRRGTFVKAVREEGDSRKLAAMTAIDPSLYEAAVIDGAGRFNRIRYVTLPGIKSTFFIRLIMNIGHLMEAGFELQYLLQSPLTVDWAQTIDIFVLKYGISKQQYGVATAAGMFKSIVAIILLFAANTIAKKLDEDTLI